MFVISQLPFSEKISEKNCYFLINLQFLAIMSEIIIIIMNFAFIQLINFNQIDQ